MRLSLLLAALALALSPTLSLSGPNGAYEGLDAPNIPAPPGPPGSVWEGPDALVLWDNGPLITGDCPNNIPPGAESQIAPDRNVYGYAHHVSLEARIADDFTVPVGVEWAIQAFTFLAYQPGAGAAQPSTVDHVNLRIWDGQPGEAGSSVICGDVSTNLLVSTGWTGIYRTSDTRVCADDRAVMANEVQPPGDCPDCPGLPGTVRLVSGTYWLDWQSDGNRDYTGPWVPPVTPPGAGPPPNNTGNAVQFQDSTWHPPSQPDDMPFIIEGDFCAVTPVEARTWGKIKAQYRDATR